MYRLAALPIAVALVYCHSTRARGQDVRYKEQDGVTIQETVRTVRRPVVETEWQQREETVYRQQLRTEMRDSLRTYLSPVTQHEWVTRMHGRWNPFVAPYFSHHLVPVTRWERRAEVVQVPVVEREWVPQKRVVSVPVTRHRVEEQQVVSRVVVGTSPSTPTPHRTAVRPLSPSARTARIGGTALESDPPRHGLQWRPPGDTVMR